MLQIPADLMPAEFIYFMFSLAFLLFVSIGLFHFSESGRFRLWAVGWFVYGLGAGIGTIRTGVYIEPVDLFSITTMLLGSIIILDGSRQKIRLGKGILYYFLWAISGLIYAVVCYYLVIRHEIAYTLVGITVAYTSILSAIEVLQMEEKPDILVKLCALGFLLWGLTGGAFPLLFFIPVHSILVPIHALAAILVGASMFILFLRRIQLNIRAQHRISHMMSSVVQHDIRSYVHVASSALEALSLRSPDLGTELLIANKALQDTIEFVEGMKRVSAALSRLEDKLIPVQLAPVIEDVKSRVQKELGLDHTQFSIRVHEDTTVQSNLLLKELLWNIVDNAFSYGGSHVIIEVEKLPRGSCKLLIIDDAGGLPTQYKEFLNYSESIFEPKPPGTSLGIVLIRGLAPLCGVRLNVADDIVESRTKGTVFSLLLQ